MAEKKYKLSAGANEDLVAKMSAVVILQEYLKHI